MTQVTSAGAQAGTVEVSLLETSAISQNPGIEFENSGPAPTPPEEMRFNSAEPVAEAPSAPAITPPSEKVDNNSVAETAAIPAIIEPAAEPAKPGFETLGLSADLLKAVAEAGYTTPTPIQAEGIPYVIKRRDVIGIGRPAPARPPASPCR